MTDGQLSEDALAEARRLAHEALDRGEPGYGVLDGRRVIVVPDVVEVAAHAVGLPDLPDSWTLRRSDGRTVKFFDGSSRLLDHKYKL